MMTRPAIPASFAGASGATYLVVAPLGQGATGWTWVVRRVGHAQDLVLKLFMPRFCTAPLRQRTAALVALRLDRASPVLHAPFDVVDGAFGLGHVSPRAGGRDLDQHRDAPGCSFLDHAVAAAAVAAGLATLERRGLSHGDLHSKNLFLEARGGVLRAGLIDFDNLVMPDRPPPLSIGQPSYYAPEIRRSGQPTSVSLATDRYALAVMLHEMLLARHPAEGAIADPDRFAQVMRDGGWPDDPAGSPHPRADSGLPVHCLDTRLQNLFRRGLAADPTVRPGASEWLAALRRSAQNVYACDHCGGPFLIDGGRSACPHCRHGFKDYALRIPAHPAVTLRRDPVAVTGRALRGDACKSTQAVLRRRGPDALIEPTGRVPVWRIGPGEPAPLEPRQAHLVVPGDRLRFGDIETEIGFDA
jgi:serine/threonine protein kinase